MVDLSEKTATLIYNPLAGPADVAGTMRLIAEQWRRRGWEVSVEPTTAAGHATELAREAAAIGKQLVLAAGGDGTLGEVVNGLAHSGTAMGVLPAGTANSFARELGLPLPTVLNENNLLAASKALLHGRVQAIDLGFTAGQGEQGGRYWVLWSGTGADAYLVDELEPRPKWSKRIGWPSYVIQGLPVLSRFSHIRAQVEVDGRALEDDYVLVLVSNCQRYAGGMVTLSHEAQVDDGLLEVWLFGGKGMLSMSRHAVRALQGQLSEDADVLLLRGKEVSVQTTPVMPVQTDGDRAGQTPLKCEIRPLALRLLTPQSAPATLFSRPALLTME